MRSFRPVIPAKAGIQSVKLFFKQRFYRLDTGGRRYDFLKFFTVFVKRPQTESFSYVIFWVKAIKILRGEGLFLLRPFRDSSETWPSPFIRPKAAGEWPSSP